MTQHDVMAEPTTGQPPRPWPPPTPPVGTASTPPAISTALLPSQAPVAGGVRLRRWQLGAAIGLVVLVVGVTGGIAVANYDRADDWKRRAKAAGAVAAELESTLRRSEADAKELQQQLDETAAEKADTEDELADTSLERDAAAYVAEQAIAVADALDVCREDLDALLWEVMNLLSGDGSYATASRYADEADASCSVADQKLASLEWLLE